VRPTGTPRVISSRRVSPLFVPGRAAAVALVASVIVLMLAAAGGDGRWLGTPVLAAAPQPQHGPAAATQEHAGGREGGEAAASHEGASPWSLVARLFNFAVLVGVLVYFLRSPFRAFLVTRGAEVRAELVKAADLRRRAGEQLAEVDRRLAALPAEIEALRARGNKEVAAEDARIRNAADAERARLVEQGRRQIDIQLRVAKRELLAHAAGLAVDVALERIRRTICDDDQRRLVDAYLGRVGAVPGPRTNSAAAPSSGGQP